jgi:oligoendopeptidase F
MFSSLPSTTNDFLHWPWAQIEPYYAELAARDLTPQTAPLWMADWSKLSSLIGEAGSRLRVAYDQNTTDPEAERRYFAFVEHIAPAAEAAEQRLKEKWLASGVEVDGLALARRNMRAEAELFCAENLPLFTEVTKLSAQYDKTVGGQTVLWEGEELPIPRLKPVLASPDRAQRERAWWHIRERQLADRASLNDLWRQLLAVRERIAANANHSDYRSFTWQNFQRFDYTPANCATFHAAIEQVCVPAATRIYERHRRQLGLEALRPWDLTDGEWSQPAQPPDASPLQPYQTVEELNTKSIAIFQRLDPQLGTYYQRLMDNGLLDLDNRKGKAPGGYCTYFAVQRRPFIFMNAVGLHEDVQVLLHEAGHAFHAFEASALPYYPQLNSPMEFNEVASMSMELLSAPYLTANGAGGGFYSEADAARARVEHLEKIILFWPYMAVVDAFQHWVYAHPTEAADPQNCDAHWQQLWKRFMPAVDWSGLEAERASGWHRKLHIFQVPFYYIEYGLAQLGAVQVWRNALADPALAVKNYRRALALGGTVSLPELYQTAGAKFAFDAETLGQAVGLIEKTIAELSVV